MHSFINNIDCIRAIYKIKFFVIKIILLIFGHELIAKNENH